MNFDVLVKLVNYGKYIVEEHLIELYKNHSTTTVDDMYGDIYTMRYLDFIGKHEYYGYKINHLNIKKFLNSSGKYNYPITE